MQRNMTLFKNQKGVALLVFVFILLLTITWMSIMMAKSGQLAQKISANQYRAQQAFEAAEAGLNFGTVYLAQNKTTIVSDANADGYIDSYSNASITNVTLSNGSKFTITFSNPTANNFNVIQIKSVGTSGDSSASREIRQLVYYTPLLLNFSSYPVVVRGSIALSGSSQINNTTGNVSIQSGGPITISGSAKTVISSGTSSTASSIKSDISQNTPALVSTGSDTFFSQHFGTSAINVKNSVNHLFQNSNNTSYDSVLNGLTSTSIWIEQTGGTATIGGSTTIGSVSAPVVLIVNGDLRLSGSSKIYGYVYVSGSLQSSNTATLTGGLAVGGNIADSGNFTMNYDTAVLNNIQQQLGQYGAIPGSWNDLQK
ncbi:MAG: hypothetical protein K0S08_1724 [Gammaproteobacteria bacterium]|nr:hypothetical protein [Gammaproteobacteria bacterium]